MMTIDEIRDLFGNSDLVDLKDVVHDLVSFQDLNRDSITNVNKWLRDHSCRYLQTKVVMYHGTWAGHDIENQGLKKTTAKTKKSIQSATGYTYLSMYPDSAQRFGEMAYAGKAVSVYAVVVPVFDLLADLDQLKNSRMWKSLPFEIKSTVGDSLVIGNGSRIKRNIENYDIRRISQ